MKGSVSKLSIQEAHAQSS